MVKYLEETVYVDGFRDVITWHLWFGRFVFEVLVGPPLAPASLHRRVGSSGTTMPQWETLGMGCKQGGLGAVGVRSWWVPRSPQPGVTWP